MPWLVRLVRLAAWWGSRGSGGQRVAAACVDALAALGLLVAMNDLEGFQVLVDDLVIAACDARTAWDLLRHRRSSPGPPLSLDVMPTAFAAAAGTSGPEAALGPSEDTRQRTRAPLDSPRAAESILVSPAVLLRARCTGSRGKWC